MLVKTCGDENNKQSSGEFDRSRMRQAKPNVRRHRRMMLASTFCCLGQDLELKKVFPLHHRIIFSNGR
jgi:hypothetical protein